MQSRTQSQNLGVRGSGRTWLLASPGSKAVGGPQVTSWGWDLCISLVLWCTARNQRNFIKNLSHPTRTVSACKIVLHQKDLFPSANPFAPFANSFAPFAFWLLERFCVAFPACFHSSGRASLQPAEPFLFLLTSLFL